MVDGKLILSHATPTRSVRIYWLLEELGVPFELDKRDFFNPATFKTEEYRALHPLQLLPVLQDDGVVLWESGAIGQYILEKYDTGNKLSPAAGSPLRPEFLKWFWFSESYNVAVVSYLNNTALYPEAERSPIVAARVLEFLTTAHKLLEGMLSDGRTYFLGDSFSAVDIFLGQPLNLAINFGNLTPVEEFPKLNAYFANLQSKPAFAKALA